MGDGAVWRGQVKSLLERLVEELRGLRSDGVAQHEERREVIARAEGASAASREEWRDREGERSADLRVLVERLGESTFFAGVPAGGRAGRIAEICPGCGHSIVYHFEQAFCAECLPPDKWPEGLVGQPCVATPDEIRRDADEADLAGGVGASTGVGSGSGVPVVATGSGSPGVSDLADEPLDDLAQVDAALNMVMRHSSGEERFERVLEVVRRAGFSVDGAPGFVDLVGAIEAQGRWGEVLHSAPLSEVVAACRRRGRAELQRESIPGPYWPVFVGWLRAEAAAAMADPGWAGGQDHPEGLMEAAWFVESLVGAGRVMADHLRSGGYADARTKVVAAELDRALDPTGG